MISVEQTSRTWTSVGSVTFVVPYLFWCSVFWYWQDINFRKSNFTSSLCFRILNSFHSVVHINKISPSPLRIFDNVNNLLGLKESYTYVQDRVLVGKPEGKIPLGRPRRRWEDNIKMDLQEVEGGCGDWMELAQDRDRWWALVSTVRNLRVPKMRGISWLAAEPISFSRRTLLDGVSK